MPNIKASIITIGDELLIGQIVDTNSAWMAKQLNELGIDVIRRVAVGDNREDIIRCLDEERQNATIILMTGGLGPTADDITKPLLCEYFGGKMIVNNEVLEHVRHIFEKRKLPILERNMKQAEVPDVCTVLFNNHGTAPGMMFEKHGNIVISMPGVPHEMMGIMKDAVLPEFSKRFASDALVHRSVITAGLGESFIAERIQDLEEALPPHIRLAYLPGAWMVKLRLTGRGADKNMLTAELDMQQQKFAERLHDIVFSLEDEPLEQVVGECLTRMNKKIALAESCTGGYVSHKITQVPGSSHYFQGNLVCYQNELKAKILGVDPDVIAAESAVCETVAIQMAQGTRHLLNADIGFGVTGLLGPESSPEDKVPAGTVWMAVTNGVDIKTQKFKFIYSRERNKEVAVQMALLLIWKFLNNRA